MLIFPILAFAFLAFCGYIVSKHIGLNPTIKFRRHVNGVNLFITFLVGMGLIKTHADLKRNWNKYCMP